MHESTQRACSGAAEFGTIFSNAFKPLVHIPAFSDGIVNESTLDTPPRPLYVMRSFEELVGNGTRCAKMADFFLEVNPDPVSTSLDCFSLDCFPLDFELIV
jgi:hypothetical protein